MVSRITPPPGAVTVEEVVARACPEVGMKVVALASVAKGSPFSGLSVRPSSGSVAVLFYPQQGSLEYRVHIVGHELWHLISGHRCNSMPDESGLRGRWGRWRYARREAQCERFAQKLGLSVSRQQNLLVEPRPIAGMMLDEAFGVRG
ncbi:hypothetical protein [Nocardia salmonicida]|uniref:hypothetical protein n=1 Tax=Nocardia salmonicida TaxID=53431 RepID=UPI0012F4CE56|nr:hypothetical protein [Nocardia salmonicida]